MNQKLKEDVGATVGEEAVDQSLGNKASAAKQTTSVTASHFHHTYLTATILWTLFFMPLTSNAYLSNAFGLPYIGITGLCLYAALGMYFICAWPVYFFLWKRRSEQMTTHERQMSAATLALGSALLGVTIKLFSFINYKQDGVFVMYCIGHIFIAFGVIVFFTISIIYHKDTAKTSYILSDLFAAIATGLTIATFVTHVAYIETDKFFTKAERAHIKNLIIMLLEWIVVLGACVAHWRKAKNTIEQQMPAQNQPTKSLDNPSCCYRWWWAQPFAVLLANIFYTYQKVVYFPLLFWFTQNEADVVATFFTIGLLLGSLNGGLVAMPLMQRFQSRFLDTRFFLVLLWTFGVVLLLATATLGQLWITCFSVFIMGLCLSVLASIELQQLPAEEVNNTAGPTIVISLACFGAYAQGLTALGDKTHFMNRDDPLWSYISMGIATFLTTLGVALARIPMKR